MALVNGTNYDHIDLKAASGGDVTRHKLQDTEARAMMAPNEADSTAASAHAAGSYFTYNNLLYQATADIASGGIIVTSGSGKNCNAVTLDGEISDLKSAHAETRHIFNEGKIDTGTLISGKYIDPYSGAAGPAADFSCTDYINIDGLTSIIACFTNTGRHNYNCFYDNAKRFISSSAFFTYPGYNTINIPSNAVFVRFSDVSARIATLELYTPAFHGIFKDVDDLQLRSSIALDILNNGKMDIGTIVEGEYVDANGAFAAASGFSRTGHIDISDFNAITVYLASSSSHNYNAFYDADKAFISGSRFYTYAGYNSVTVPSGAKYVALSETTAKMANIAIYNSLLYGMGKRIEDSETDIDDIEAKNANQDLHVSAIEDEALGKTLYYVNVFNGSAGNPGNANAVCTANGNLLDLLIPINEYEYATCKVNRPVDSSGAQYRFNITSYNAQKTALETSDWVYTATGEVTFPPVGSGVAYVAFSIGERDASSTAIPLRETMFSLGDVEIRIMASDSILQRNDDVLDAVYASCKYGVHGSGTENNKKEYSMLVTTDVHGSSGVFANAISYLNNVVSIDSGICLGDIVPQYYSEDSSWYNACVAKSNKPFYTVIGNHDAGNSDLTARAGTNAQIVGKFITPNEAKMGKSGLTVAYYSFYDSSHKLYFIVLNNYDSPDTLNESNFAIPKGAECYSQTQIDWFIDELENIPSDYSLVLIRHAYYEDNTEYDCSFSQPDSVLGGNTWKCYGTEDIIPYIINLWINGGSGSKSVLPSPDYSSYLSPLSISADFTSRGAGKFICHLVGHAHRDCIVHSTTYPGQLAVGLCATAFDLYQNANSDLPRVQNRKSMDAITVVSFNTAEKRVNLVRVGSNKTTYMMDRTMISLPYGE